MSSKEVTRRKFFGDVAKYCGAGVAALGMMGPGRVHGVDDLDTPAHEGVWRMRDTQLKQYGEFVKNAPLPKDYFEKKPENLVDGGKPVNWSHLHPNWYGEGNKSSLGLTMATPLDKELKGDIKKAVKLIGGFEKSLKKTDKILIKPNMNTGDPWPQGGTDPAFLEALILVLKDEGYTNLTVADTCGPWGPTERVMKKMGYDSVSSRTGTPLKTWENEKWMNIRNAKAEFLGRFGGGDGTIAYPDDLRNYDKVIYTPVMKTHFLGGITMSLKLSVGILHRADRGAHLHTFNHLFVAEQAAEINLPFQPDLIIMDGRRSLISGGPSHGEQVKPGVILASGDQVATDVIGIRILQEWYPNMAQNKIGMYAWYQKQIAQAVKVGVGFARKQDDIKLVLG
ncbi:MAG: hypothetical protein A2V86_07540 [Deltaproteobacteria bacterium RBG_16_49_23]|nr:MAG: hypothetical protein A2V86_07540 [Deltaproteobacteria bacterium RBG_16_49_23]